MKKNTRLFLIILAIPVLLLIPFIAMQYTGEVNWSNSDFIIMGVLLLFLGLLIEFILRSLKKNKSRVIFILIALFFFFIVWAELAVGIFGTPFAGT